MRAIITGAAGAIGAATAKQLTKEAISRGEKTQIMLVDLKADSMDALVQELEKEGADVLTIGADLSDPESPQQVIDNAIQAFGGLDALVSNAGIIKRGNLLEMTVDDFDQAIAINTRATWLLGKAAFPYLVESKGCIVATASISATHAAPPLGAYSVSKAAVVMLIKQMSIDWGPQGIRCNCISPGSTHTAMTDARYSVPELRADAEAMNPARMVGQPEHQAAAIAFLCSPGAAYINGENIVVDGGMSNNLMVASSLGDPWKK